MKTAYTHIETKLIHAGEPEPRIHGAVSMPIFQSTMYEDAGEKNYHDIRYIRLNNTPNHIVLQEKLAALENAESALVTASGMAAITTSLLTVLQSGDHLIAQDCLYGGTYTFITEELPRFGISFDFVDCDTPDSLRDKMRKNTKAIYVESMTNPLLQVADLKSVVDFSRAHKLVSLIDNTFASPINFRPIEVGFDLSLHSCTKYLNGHSDIVAGAVLGRADLIRRITHRLNHLGASLDPHTCFLLYRGVKTLALRVRYQNESTLRIAQFLENHSAVVKVNYPGLRSHPAHQRARRLFEGSGGVLSFELKDPRAVESFIRNSSIATNAVSVGGIETLVTRPATSVHSGLSPEDRKRLGISECLVRLSVGIESTEDIIEDFETALVC